MSAETFEQMALRVADDQAIIWREGCAFESGITSDEAVSFAAAIRDELAKQQAAEWADNFAAITCAAGEIEKEELANGAEPVAWLDLGRMTNSGMVYATGFKVRDAQTPLYTYPPAAAARIAELETQRNELLADVERCYRMLLSEPDTKGALFKAENIMREAIAKAKEGK